MADNTATAQTEVAEVKKVELPPLISGPLEIERNGVKINFVDLTKEKGSAYGEHYISIDPEIFKKDPKALFDWVGMEQILSYVESALRKNFQLITKASIKDKVLSISRFQKYAPLLVAAKESMKDLQAKQLALTLKMVELDMNTPEGLLQVKSLMEEVQEVASLIKARQDAKAEKDDEEDENLAPTVTA